MCLVEILSSNTAWTAYFNHQMGLLNMVIHLAECSQLKIADCWVVGDVVVHSP